MTAPINYTEQAFARLLTQFKESSNLIQYINNFLIEFNELENAMQENLLERWIDTAFGIQLDVLGIIVGQPRAFSYSVAETFFGFNEVIGADTFSTVGAPATGSRFRSLSDIEFVQGRYNDNIYRIFIRTKVLKNKTHVTIEDVIEIVLAGVTSSPSVTVSETQAAFKLIFAGVLSDGDKLLLTETDFTPTPAGVSVTYADQNGDFT